jgi:hypothetical protein
MIYLALLFLLWYLTPHVMLYLCPIPQALRFKAHWGFLKLSLVSLLILLPGLLAPLVVPVALLFTKWEDDDLPKLFQWWDNDVSINGDDVGAWGLDYKQEAYYASAPPRSFWARFVWLGLRNRCSRLVEMLGYRYEEGEFKSRTVLGDPKVDRGHNGWRFTYTKNIQQLMIIKGAYRFNWGYKFFDKPVTPSATISASFLSKR